MTGIVFLLTASILATGSATRPGMLVSTEWLSQHLADSRLVILDIAPDRSAFDAGHIPGARFIALGDLAVTRNGIPNELPTVRNLKTAFQTAGVTDNSRVVLYTDAATILPATRAYFTLDFLGHGERTAVLDGGFKRWLAENRGTSKDLLPPPDVRRGHFTPKPRPEVVVPLDAVRHPFFIDHSDVLLDVRSPDEYQAARIPGALNAHWLRNLDSSDNPVLKPEAVLRKWYEDLGVTPDKRAVIYCSSGMQASQSYFTLKYLGYDVRLYDGSMAEWTARHEHLEK